ncbi:glycoprotein 3-alpha-L-fucosyltransferase A-like isoform X1 [Cynara cardunculus var. scolymus]|uniref:glycoprotein 3-alpha-L-fucosyltransferase A-like isoform X1 n=1 Tax=Cynara cardunculus var. scolymus TaxID=59895 RepID=UPI000D6289D5|nr:glycoprotein 3-alpha-L-fucosyltransferase A-like isoform X1 [Cynara cardunculus var. scolymus]
MGLLNPNQRSSRGTQLDPHLTSSSSSSASNSPSSINMHNSRKKWSNLLPLFLVLVFIAEISFLGRLDLIKNTDLLNSWTESFYQFTTTSFSSSSLDDADEVSMLGLSGAGLDVVGSDDGGESCEEWLEREDSVVYSRDFEKHPVYVTGAEQEWKSCDVECKFGFDNKKADAAFGLPNQAGTAGVLRSMESAQYYAENNIAMARRKGYNIIMTTSLSSDVPVGYFSWAEYDMMAPVQPKTEKALAAAFISNCAARNFRLQALEGLEKSNIKIDSYGGCHRNRDGNVNKVEALKRYKFSLAFENSNEEDYVTEKFFQSLVAGSVPVVVGAPNIQDFAPAPGSILHIKELKDIDSVAKTMKHLAENPVAYNESLRWKYDGPSDSFMALVDMAAVHSSCRLCIFLATRIHEKEEKSSVFPKRPCKCRRGSETVYHIYVRERGRFNMESVFLRSGNLTMDALETAVLLKFKSLKHEPIWRNERPESIRGDEKVLKVYRIYPVGMTQRQALYTFSFKSSTAFTSHIKSNPCAKFEVILV